MVDHQRPGVLDHAHQLLLVGSVEGNHVRDVPEHAPLGRECISDEIGDDDLVTFGNSSFQYRRTRVSIKLLPRERYLRTARPSRGNRGGPARRGSRCYELGKLLSDVPACRAIGSITGTRFVSGRDQRIGSPWSCVGGKCPLQERSHSMLHASLLLVVRDERADDPNRAGKRLR